METTNQNSDIFEPRKKGLPGMLNTLTILTFIGCGIAYIGGIWGFIQNNDYEKQMSDFQESIDKAPEGWARNMIESSMQMFEKSHEHRYILVATALIFTTFALSEPCKCVN
jgi:hypothetical protein